MVAGSAPSQDAYGCSASPSTMTAAPAMLSRSGPTTSSSPAQATALLSIPAIPHRMTVATLELRVVHVPATEVRLALGPDAVEISGSIVHGLRVVPVRMVEPGRGLIVPGGRRNGHARLGAPVRGTVGTAAHVDIPDAAFPCRAGARAGVIASRACPIVHPNNLDVGRVTRDSGEAMPDPLRSQRHLRSVRPRRGAERDIPGRAERVGVLRVDPFRDSIRPRAGVIDHHHPVV